METGSAADEKVLNLLRGSVLPLERGQMARELGWSKVRVGRVLLRLIQLHLVIAVEQRTDTGGRPAAKFVLRPAEDRPAGFPPKPRFERDTIVITPSNREARVLVHRRDGFVEIEYLDGPRTDARTAIHEDLLRAIQPGRARPSPVLVTT